MRAGEALLSWREWGGRRAGRRGHRPITQKEVADALGTVKGQIGRLEAGQEPHRATLEKLVAWASSVIGREITTEQFLEGPVALAAPVPSQARQPLADAEPTRVAVFDQETLTSWEDSPIEPEPTVLPKSLTWNKTVNGLRVRSSAMRPMAGPGSLALVDIRRHTLEDGRVYVICHHGEVLIRRFRSRLRGFYMEADNTDDGRAFAPIYFERIEDIEYMGWVFLYHVEP